MAKYMANNINFSIALITAVCYSLFMEGHQGSFIWDPEKELINIKKHGLNFFKAAMVFKDPERKIYTDSKHSHREERHFCIGKVGDEIITVRFIYRDGKIRIFGAGLWRKGVKYYGEKD